jgi:hypothetical protein
MFDRHTGDESAGKDGVMSARGDGCGLNNDTNDEDARVD